MARFDTCEKDNKPSNLPVSPPPIHRAMTSSSHIVLPDHIHLENHPITFTNSCITIGGFSLSRLSRLKTSTIL
ncbi:LOW QUALITY PROTEIN: hypothetical protein TorRG33x02_054400 [Trema orientale]|uniref:Uncharacterized protein n=1 Tax=Trema orientale TaxID=63057 RepID=A0A2P5FM02_TREOI|nr:LOW QUALITY PROTEIN: hypothetical protein TorRG33x02_054400 [Trema orientale]